MPFDSVYKLLIMVVFYFLIAPELLAVISISGQPDEGQYYTLTCEIRLTPSESLIQWDKLLAVNETQFQWDNINGHQNLSQLATLSFLPLSREDSGEYRCTAIITSPYLSRMHVVSFTTNVTVNRKL